MMLQIQSGPADASTATASAAIQTFCDVLSLECVGKRLDAIAPPRVDAYAGTRGGRGGGRGGARGGAHGGSGPAPPRPVVLLRPTAIMTKSVAHAHTTASGGHAVVVESEHVVVGRGGHGPRGASTPARPVAAGGPPRPVASSSPARPAAPARPAKAARPPPLHYAAQPPRAQVRASRAVLAAPAPAAQPARPPCLFVSSAAGCAKGDACPFSHGK